MLIYIEHQAKDFPQTQKILEQFPRAQKIYIQHYKNIFDKNIPAHLSLKPSFVIAKLNSPALTKAPPWYGHNNHQSYFLKTSLNCIFDCAYCFLKGAFKNDIPVYFVNYEEIKKEIQDLMVHQKRNIKNGDTYANALRLYSGDYSDIVWMNTWSGFLDTFVPFVENLAGVMMEVRTKSAQIQAILDLWFIPQHTEFAFSLNPQELIEKYEKGTASLSQRIEAINTLLDKWYQVGLRFLPLLPVDKYQEIYTHFVQEIKKQIDMSKIRSTFASGLLFTKGDYKRMLKKHPDLDILYRLQEEDDGFVRESKEMRAFFYDIFADLDNKCFICLDER